MSTRINTNIGALNALKSLNDIGNKLSIAQLRLSTGKRINNAADDAAGFSIAKKFNTRSKGLGQAINNIGTAKNLISVTEGHLNNIVNILTQMKTKAIQGADDSLGTAERNAINAELAALVSQIDLEVNQAVWNEKGLLNGIKTSGDSDAIFNFQIGAGSTISDVLKFDLFNDSNVGFSTGNTGFTTKKLQVNVKAHVEGNRHPSGINMDNSFADAGFKDTPNGTVTINGRTFNLSDYATVYQFYQAVNTDPLVNAGITLGPMPESDRGLIRVVSSTLGSPLVISETGSPGFLTAANIPEGTYDASPGVYTTAISTSRIVNGIDVSKSIDNAGFFTGVSGPVTINGVTYNPSSYSTVQAFMDAFNNDANANVIISYDRTEDKFSIEQKSIGTNLTISTTGIIFGVAGIVAGTYTGASVSTSSSAQNYMRKIDNALEDVSKSLNYIGAVTNRLTYQENSLTTSKTNTDAARSRIEDADMAEEQLNTTKLQILQQTSSAMLAQANISPQTIMNLFK
ncbi:MAG: flagellin [Candidatus Kuenenia stuttgartiensis]|nr:flagellin [Candidatus Kuenenia stuttgartiensis]